MASSLCEIQLESKEDLFCMSPPNGKRDFGVLHGIAGLQYQLHFPSAAARAAHPSTCCFSLSLPHLVTHSYPPLPPVYFPSVCSPHTYPRTVIYPHISICFPQALQYKSFALGNWRHCCYFDKFPGGITQGLVCWGKFWCKLVVRASLNFSVDGNLRA